MLCVFMLHVFFFMFNCYINLKIINKILQTKNRTQYLSEKFNKGLTGRAYFKPTEIIFCEST